ncbi:spore gernimation protein GerQ, partial [Bacillus vallismortis]|nr:spore gernimation protein GerQ [Bacillus vallismortis]MCY8533848.1 spore gernimation protein GerQ [Bacillus vallismortis]MCY8546183.1 spore gernimation protein GerQ [Bacillus vallismortis]
YCSHKRRSRSCKKSYRSHNKPYYPDKKSHKKHYKKPHHHYRHKKDDDFHSKKEFWKDGNCWVVKKKYK